MKKMIKPLFSLLLIGVTSNLAGGLGNPIELFPFVSTEQDIVKDAQRAMNKINEKGVDIKTYPTRYMLYQVLSLLYAQRNKGTPIPEIENEVNRSTTKGGGFGLTP